MESEVYAPHTCVVLINRRISVSLGITESVSHDRTFLFTTSARCPYMVISPNKGRPVSQSLIGGLLAFLQLINLVNRSKLASPPP